MDRFSELREKVARAIYEGRNGVGCKPWARLPNTHKDPYLSDADAALRVAVEACAAVAEEWKSAGTARLRAGELSAQEMRAVMAVSTHIATTIRALAPEGK